MARHGAYRTPGELTLRSSPGTGGLWLTNYLYTDGNSGLYVEIQTPGAYSGEDIDGRVTIRRTDWDSLWDATRERTIATGPSWGVAWRKDSEFSTPYIQASYIRSDNNGYIRQWYITDLGLTDDSAQELSWHMDDTTITMTGPAGTATPFATFGSPSTIKSQSNLYARVMSTGTSFTGLDGNLSDFSWDLDGVPVADLYLAGMTSGSDTSWTNTYGDTVVRSSGLDPSAAGGTISPLTELRPWRRRLSPT